MLTLSLNLKSKLARAEKDFSGSKYEPCVQEAINLYLKGDYELVEKKISLLPSGKDLLESLLKKLEGKSVYRTLKKISEDKIENEWEKLKGLFSLGTHICIECEHGNLEYKKLLRELFERLSKELSQVL